MAFKLPTVSEFKSQLRRDFPYASPAWGALASLTVVNGVITAATLKSGGQGYKEQPDLSVESEFGAGVVLTIGDPADGAVVAPITVANGGTQYADTDRVIFSGGSGGDETDLKKVTDDDIQQASLDAAYNVNPGLFADQATFGRAFIFLQAHCLVRKIADSQQGLASQADWLTQSKTVGNVSHSFVIPKQVMDDPELAQWSTTGYGMQYLQIILPLLRGNFQTFHRFTLP